MSGALAAALQSACCCGRDGGGGGGSPDDCGPSGPGAASDRATTAIAISLDIDYTEFALENKIRSWRSIGGFPPSFSYAEANCVIQNGTSCENEYPNGDLYIPYGCGPVTFIGAAPLFHEARGFNPPTAPIRYGTCYNQTGDSNHLPNFITQGTACTCQRLGGCAGCSAKSVVASDGQAIAEQVLANGRRWRTYQTAASLVPDHRIGEWNWQPRQYTVRTVSGPGFSHEIRLFCQPPYPLQQYGQALPTTFMDPTGAYVNADPDQRYPFVTGRWGHGDVGKLYAVADVLIEYVDSYVSAGVNLGPGWVGTVRVAHIYRDQHLAARHRFGLVGQTRWTVNSAMPPEQGYLPLTTAWIQSVVLPWTMWKPCLSESDTVFGAYIAIGPSLTGDPAEREYSFFDPCAIAGQRRLQAYLHGMTVS